MQTAIIAVEKGKLAISNNVQLPDIEPDMVIVRTKYVALNPADAKMVEYSAAPGAIAGYDFAGDILALGSPVTRPLATGDRVCGQVHGMNLLCPRVVAFAQYIGATEHFVMKIPDSMSYKTAAGLGTSVGTTGLALFQSLKIPATPEKPAAEPFFVLVYGAIPAFAQLLYAQRIVRRRCQSYTKNTYKYALGCITEAATMEICYAATGRTGGNCCGLEPYPERQHTRKLIKPD